jgi:hypothetical protein
MRINIKDAASFPVVINRVHESSYKAFYTLDIVKEMLKRKDSYQTILEVIDTIYQFEVPDKTLP